MHVVGGKHRLPGILLFAHVFLVRTLPENVVGKGFGCGTLLLTEILSIVPEKGRQCREDVGSLQAKRFFSRSRPSVHSPPSVPCVYPLTNGAVSKAGDVMRSPQVRGQVPLPRRCKPAPPGLAEAARHLSF
ncbi:hypothetical protein BDW75DRAFT_62253 [Aspergillus navahoensis]